MESEKVEKKHSSYFIECVMRLHATTTGEWEAYLHIVQEERVVNVDRGFFNLGCSLAQGIPSLAQLAEAVSLSTQLTVQMRHFLGQKPIPSADKEQLFSHMSQNLNPRACLNNAWTKSYKTH
jgi:hypothetical protein